MIERKPYTGYNRPMPGDVVILNHDPTRAYLINFQGRLLRFSRGKYVSTCFMNFGIGWVEKIGEQQTPDNVYVTTMRRRYIARGETLTKQHFSVSIPKRIRVKMTRAQFYG